MLKQIWPRSPTLQSERQGFFTAAPEEALLYWVPDVPWSLSSSLRWPRNQEPCRHLSDKVVVMAGPRCHFVPWRKGLLAAGSCRPALFINACGPSGGGIPRFPQTLQAPGNRCLPAISASVAAEGAEQGLSRLLRGIPGLPAVKRGWPLSWTSPTQCPR